MKRPRFSFYLALVASGGLLLPSTTLEAAPPSAPSGQTQASRSAPVIRDVALGTDGALQGMVVDAQGLPLAKVPVVVRQGTQESARAVTGTDGRFVVSGLRGGVYDVAAGEGSGTFRLWAASTAPPTAISGVLVVARSNTVRGQMPLENLLTSDAFLITVIAAAAIAIPVAIHNSRHAKKSGS